VGEVALINVLKKKCFDTQTQHKHPFQYAHVLAEAPTTNISRLEWQLCKQNVFFYPLERKNELHCILSRQVDLSVIEGSQKTQYSITDTNF
jgi:hypothetical protein